ncbi:MAG: outer membrane beta-barrel protein [Bacteroidaceae bacterium]|nr:outer membrane beta-barrel protein [Bacteroidaceae bacterium]
MKKMFLMAAMAVASLTANAQTWIGGSLGFDYEKYKNADAKTYFSIAPTVGYNLSDAWAIGLELNLGFGSEGMSSLHESGYKTTEVKVAPFARYTFAKLGMASFFVDGGFGLGYAKLEKNGVSADGTTWHIGFRPGISLAFSENLSGVATLGYLGFRHMEDYSHFGLNANGNALSLGLYYTF